MFEWFKTQFTNLMQFIADVLLWVPRQLVAWILDALASLIEAIPVPAFVNSIDGYLSAIDPGIMYFASFMQLDAAIAIIMSAHVIRFGIRRLPFIG